MQLGEGRGGWWEQRMRLDRSGRGHSDRQVLRWTDSSRKLLEASRKRFLTLQIHRRAVWFLTSRASPTPSIHRSSPGSTTEALQHSRARHLLWAAHQGPQLGDTLQASPGPGQALVPPQLRLFSFSCHAAHEEPRAECLSLTILRP